MELKPIFVLTLAILSFQREIPSTVSPQMRPIDAVVRTMNWPDFHQPAIGAVPEVRITDWYPNYAGAQIPFLRLIKNGAHFEAQLFVWWPKRDSPPMPRAGPGIRCGDGSDSQEVCVQAIAVPVGNDWDDIAARALNLNEPCRPEIRMPPATPGAMVSGVVSVVFDAGDLLIEALDGRTRRTYWCNAPTSGSAMRPVDGAAVDMYKLITALAPRIR